MAKRPPKDLGLFAPTTPAKQQNSKTVERQDVKPVKVTVYLTPNTAVSIDEAQAKLKRLTGMYGHEVSKSAIVEAALGMAFEELEGEGENSRLVSLLSKR
jgi:hypothetical protein